MKKIGICGGIGSGKSVVSRILKNFGFAVYDSDSSAKQLMKSNLSIRTALIERFGYEIYDGENLNKPLLSQRIFSNKQDRFFVNQVVHPIVAADFLQWSAQQKHEMVFIESAILSESSITQLLDASIFVEAPQEVRVERVIQRNHCSKEDALARVFTQNVEQDKKNCRFIIQNDNKTLVTKQLLSILKDLT